MAPPRAERRPGASTLLALLVLGACAPLSRAPVPALEPGALERIQRQCLRAYPPELLAPMASGAEEVPAEVEADPTRQMRFLDRELALDKGLFYPSLLEELLPAFQAYVRPGVRFLDLGSGDGRAVFLAAALGAKATGVEYDGTLVEVSRRALDALDGIVARRRVRFIQRDFFQLSWSRYELIFYFDQSSHEQERVRAKMRRELASGARLIVSHEQRPFLGLEVEATYPDLKVYCRPALKGRGCARR